MSTVTLTAYALMWPAIVLVVMIVIGRAFFTEWREARRSGRDLV